MGLYYNNSIFYFNYIIPDLLGASVCVQRYYIFSIKSRKYTEKLSYTIPLQILK